MFDRQYHIGTQLYKMVMYNDKIKKSVLALGHRIIEMVHSERFDPQSIEFNVMVPKGEENKFHITLIKAEYSTKPIIEAADDQATTSLVRVVDSLFKAVGATSAMLGFLNVCPGLCNVIYSVCNYLNEYHYSVNRKDLRREIVWDCYDHHKEKDLVITGVIS